jgi:hypothetical protein
MCTSLTTVNLDNVKNIYGNAFYGCEALNKVNLDKVENIKEMLFLIAKL